MRPLTAVAVIALLCGFAAPASSDDEALLTRIRGDVAYRSTAARGDVALFGTITLHADAIATTAARSLAHVVLADSSLVEIGDRTSVRIGAVSAAADGSHAFELRSGALRFVIKHPAGSQTTYRFSTPTSSISVRGTTAYLIVGRAGDQIYCIDCPPGDVTVNTGTAGSYGVLSGQSLNVHRVAGRAFSAEIVANEALNNPAVDQFLGGKSPFGKDIHDHAYDFTESGSGSDF